MRIKADFFLIFLLIMGLFYCNCFYVYAQTDLPAVIETQSQAESMLVRAKSIMKTHLGVTFRNPLKVVMVTGEELDKMVPNSPYRGSVVGLHQLEGGVHKIYMMQNVGRDQFVSTLCHEMTHAWQEENCPNQDLALKEGLAVWVEYKSLIWEGAYALAQRLNQSITGPVYGVGYRFIQKVEDKYGEKGVLAAVKGMTKIDEKF